MIKLDPQVVKDLLKSTAGKELVQFLKETIKSTDRVTDIELTNPQAIAIETLARKKTAEKLAEILKPFLHVNNITNKEEPEVY